MEINKYFKILIAFVLILLFLTWVWFLLELLGVINKKEVEEDLPVVKEDLGEITNVYGVQIHNKCFIEYQGFLEKYGADYSKCLVDFDFSKDQYCSGVDPETQAFSDVNMIVILDASGSMSGKVGSDKKIDIAKKVIFDFLVKMPQGVNTGLIVYGHKGSNLLSDKDLSCKGIEEIIKLGKNKYSDIISAVNSFEPKGWTPIAASLNFAKDIFKKSGNNNKNYLILVSDGIESCEGDPLSAAENLRLEVSNINLNVIGFTTDYDAQQLLTNIARVAKGSYLSVYSSSSIAKAFNNQLLIIKRDCLKMAFLRISSMYKTNNLNNLNCWLSKYNKESNDLKENILSGFISSGCSLEISDVLKARHAEFWKQMRDLEEKNDIIHKKLQSELEVQLKTLDSQKSYY